MMPPGTSLVGPSANMMPSSHQPPAMFNPTTAANYGAQPQGQPPSMASLNKPPQARILPPPPSNTGVGSMQHQFPPPPKSGLQPNVEQSLQQLPTNPSQLPPPPSGSTHPPVGLPTQQVTPALPNTNPPAVVSNQQAQIQPASMSAQLQPHSVSLTQPNIPPIMSTMAGPLVQPLSTNQFSGQTTVGTVQAAPPMISAQHPPMMSIQQQPPNSTTIASNAITAGPPVSGVPTRPPGGAYVGSNLTGPSQSTGTAQAGIPPPPGNLVSTVIIESLFITGILGPMTSTGVPSFSNISQQQSMREYQQGFPPPPQSSAPPPPPPSGGNLYYCTRFSCVKYLCAYVWLLICF